MESDPQSTLAGNKFYKTSDHLLQKGKISLRHGCESQKRIEMKKKKNRKKQAKRPKQT